MNKADPYLYFTVKLVMSKYKKTNIIGIIFLI